MASSIQWDASEVIRNLTVYRGKVHQACFKVAQYFEPIVESQAKINARWTDRTGQARLGLTGLAVDVSETIIELYLYGKAPHQIFLELRNSGRYAIILETLEAQYGAIFAMLQDVLK